MIKGLRRGQVLRWTGRALWWIFGPLVRSTIMPVARWVYAALLAMLLSGGVMDLAQVNGGDNLAQVTGAIKDVGTGVLQIGDLLMDIRDELREAREELTE